MTDGEPTTRGVAVARYGWMSRFDRRLKIGSRVADSSIS